MKTVDFSETFRNLKGFSIMYLCVCGTFSAMLSGLASRSLGLHTLGTK